MVNLKRSILVSIITLCFVLTGVSIYADETDAPTEPETEPQAEQYVMRVDGEDIMVVNSEKDGEAAIKEIVDDMVPKNSKLRAYSIAETVEYVKLDSNLLTAGLSIADDKDDVTDVLEEKMKSSDPLLTVTIVSDKYKVKKTPIRVKFKYKKNLYAFEFVAKTKGKKGKTKTRYELTSVNGKVTDKVKKETKTIDKGKYKIVYTGRKSTPKNITATRYKSYKVKIEKKALKTYGDVFLGRKLVEYGKKFLGNPYRVGGKSLTHGIDCVQFVRALYKKFGINLPENKYKLFHTGKKVPYSKARPGDVVFYGTHPAIYIGNGKIISARKKGISISKINYKRWTYIRRIK